MCLILSPALEQEVDLRYQKILKSFCFKKRVVCYKNSSRELFSSDFDR